MFTLLSASYAYPQEKISSRDTYLKLDKGNWVEVYKPEGGKLTILNPKAEPPKQESLAYSNLTDFNPYIAIHTGSWPEAVAIGDVNNDQRNDVVLVTSHYFDPKNDFKLFVFLQNQNGSLDSPIRYDTAGSRVHSPVTVAIGDFNSDDRNDVAVGLKDDRIQVFLQKESGILDIPFDLMTNNARKIRAGDFNHDGRTDLAGIGSDNVEIFFQYDTGGFMGGIMYLAEYGGYSDLRAGDVNHDGLTDLVVTCGCLDVDAFSVLLQNDQWGGFEPPMLYSLENDLSIISIAIGNVNVNREDVDTIKLQDVIAACYAFDPDSHIAIFPQNRSGLLDSPESLDSYDCLQVVETGDINSDGFTDIVVLHGGAQSSLGVYVQRQDGNLSTEALYDIPYASQYNSHGLALGDINSDGKNDVVIADYNNGLVILYNNSHFNKAVKP